MAGTTSGRTGTITVMPVAGAPSDIYALCHDMAQPIATIRATLSAAHHDPGVGPDARRWLGQIASEAERLAAMLDLLMTGVATFEPLDLRALLGEIATAWTTSGRGAVMVRPSSAPVAPTVTAEPVLLRRAVENLVANAVRAAGPSGRVELSVTVLDDWVGIDVDDDGPGMGGSRPGAAGLGLGIVRQIAHDHGGTLLLNTSALGGVRARVVLPSALAGELVS